MTKKLAALFAGTYQPGVCFLTTIIVRRVDILPAIVGGAGSNPPTEANPVATFIDRLPQNTPYLPASLPDWNGTPPLTIQAALDRIAAKITPIP